MIGIGNFGVGGSNIDVVKLVAKLTIPEDARPKVDEQLRRAQRRTSTGRCCDCEKNMEDEQKQMGAVQRTSMLRTSPRNRAAIAPSIWPSAM